MYGRGCSQVAIYLAVFPDPNQIYTLAWSPTPFLLLFVAAGVALRNRAVAAARRLVADDRAEYEALWAQITAAPGAVNALESIHVAAARLEHLEASCSRRTGCPRQHDSCQRRPVSSPTTQWWELACCEGSDVDGVGMGEPTRCLDQLYAQAVAAAPLLLERVRTWALLSEGGFPLVLAMPGCVWVRWRDVHDNPALFCQIRWGQCKSTARAIEKIVRSYNQVQPPPNAANPPEYYLEFEIFAVI